MLKIEIIFVPETGEAVRAIVEVRPGITAQQAIAQSNILEDHPQINYVGIGINGRTIDPAERVRAGDRIELYRELICDPKQARLQRVNKKSK